MCPAQMASNDATPTGSVHKYRGDRVVCMCAHLDMGCVVCVSILQRGRYGEVCVHVNLCIGLIYLF